MENKTIFAVSTADSELFKDNYRNSFTNHFPHFQESSFNYKICLSSIAKNINQIKWWSEV